VTPHDADRLYEELRAWRLELSRAEGVPAFVVFSNAHLRGIAERAPRTVADLARCSGVGEVKLERYGEDVLDVIERVLG
jgi:superfamily II DNA helicase RecQ